MRDISRRSFVELFAGTLVSLPVLAGGLVLAPQVASAEPDATDADELAGKESKPIIIDVVEPWEVGFIVVDVTKSTVDESGMVSYTPCPRADVTVTSRFNGQAERGTTDDNGVVNIDVRKLCVVEEGQDVNNLDVYYFNGSIEVTCNGYRKFQTALVAIEGGSGLQVPGHPADEVGTPYPQLVSFDEWDALYSKNDFLVTPANAGDHTIGVSLLNLPSEGGATIEFWVDGEESPRKSDTATIGDRVQVGTKTEKVLVGYRTERQIIDYNLVTGEPVYFEVKVPVYEDREVPVYGTPAKVSFSAPFLKKDDAACLPVGGSFRIVAKQGDTSYSWPLAFTVSAGVVDEPFDKENQTCQPIEVRDGDGVKAQGGLVPLGATGLTAQGKTGFDAKWPSSVPIIGGGDLLAWVPELPIGIYVNPFGLVQVTLSIPLWGYRNDKGNGDPHGWGRYPRMSVHEQWERKKKVFNAMKDKTEACVSKPGNCQQIDLFKNFSVDINFQFLALAEWNSEKGTFGGQAAGQILAAVNFTITENFFAGPIPVLITFAVDASLTFGLTAALSVVKKNEKQSLASAVGDFSNWSWDYSKGGFTMTFSITPSLSVGVGVRGIASISVKGAVTLTLFLGVPMGAQPSYLPSPHFTAGWSAQVSLVLEMFLFTENFPLYSKKFENFFDNWEGLQSAAMAEDALKGELASMSLDELLAGLKPITDEMLAETTEASIPSGGNLSFIAVEPWDWNGVKEEMEEQTEDGETVYCTVYDFTGSPDAGLQGLGAQGQGDEATTDEGPQGVTGQQDTAEQVDVLAASDGVLQAQVEEPAGLNPGSAAAEQPQAEQPQADQTQAEQAQPDQTQPERPQPDQTQADQAQPDQPQPEQPQPDQPASETPSEDAATLEPQEEVALLPDVTWLAPMADVELPSPAILALGAAGGVRPSSDKRILGNDDRHVFGASRSKIVSFGINERTGTDGGVWLFRLASVEVGGKARTRIVGTCIDGLQNGTMRIVEFDTAASSGISHDELYDYDFDVAAGYDHFESYLGNYHDGRSAFFLSFTIVSGRRATGGSSTLAAAATDLVVSNVLYLDELELFSSGYEGAEQKENVQRAYAYYRDHEFLKGQVPLCISRIGKEVIGFQTEWQHSVVSVQTRYLKASTRADEPFFSVATFLDRCADTPEGTLGEGADVHLGVVGFSWLVNVAKPGPKVYVPKMSDFVVSDRTSYELAISMYGNVTYSVGLASYAYYVVMLRGAQKAHYLVLLVCTNEFGKTRVKSLGDYDPSIRLVPCPAQDYCLASYPTDPAELNKPADQRDYSKWTLHKVTHSKEQWPMVNPKLIFEPIGQDGFNVVNFAVNPKGTFIFWPHTRDADEDRVFHADGTEDVKPREPVYQIMACRIRGDHFSDPFVVADLPTDTDALSVVGTSANAVAEMVRTVYVDTGERGDNGLPLYHAADMWYTAVPAVRCATATACEAPNPFVSPGGKIAFHVAVRNDGNTFLSGCSLTLCALNEETGAYERVDGATSQVTFGKDTICESTYNRDDGQGGLTNLEPDYALGPGKTSVYQVEVRVPKGWKSGERKVLFVASDGVVAPDLAAQGELSAMAEELDAEAVEFHIEPGEYKVVQQRTQVEADAERRYMDTIVVASAAAEGAFDDAPTTVSGESEVPSGTAPAAPTKQEVLPRTGDGGSGAGLGLAGLGLAAMGAAVATYERRRAENEGK